jgi:hypothetical protein
MDLAFAAFAFVVAGTTIPARLCFGLGLCGAATVAVSLRHHIRPLSTFWLVLPIAFLLPTVAYVLFLLRQYLLDSPGESRGFHFVFLQLAFAWSALFGLISWFTVRALLKRLARCRSRQALLASLVPWSVACLVAVLLLFPIAYYVGLELS